MFPIFSCLQENDLFTTVRCFKASPLTHTEVWSWGLQLLILTAPNHKLRIHFPVKIQRSIWRNGPKSSQLLERWGKTSCDLEVNIYRKLKDKEKRFSPSLMLESWNMVSKAWWVSANEGLSRGFHFQPKAREKQKKVLCLGNMASKSRRKIFWTPPPGHIPRFTMSQ